MKFRNEYTYTRRHGNPLHRWSTLTYAAGAHVWISDLGEQHEEKYPGMRYTGGIEIHYRIPPDYMRDQPPTHDDCFLLKAPCWHDGSSLQASEFWIPRWLTMQNDHDAMFLLLNRDLEQRLIPDPD